MNKGADAFRSIGEVAKLLGVAPHVLRYWETQFSLLRPMKRPDGRRYYRPDDVRLAAGLCEVLREDGLTIRGAKKLLARDRGQALRERGAQRLDLTTPAEPVPSAAPEPQVSAPQQSPHQPTEEEMPMSQPKSRRRHRRASGSGDASLPLFPEMQDNEVTKDNWLACLVTTAAQLRALDTRDPRFPAARGKIAALGESIARLY